MADDILTNLWNGIKGWASDNAQQYLYVPIPRAQTDMADADDALRPFYDYFRLWLSEMYLTNSRAWFTNWYPAVHSAVQLKYAGQDIRLSAIARPPTDALNRGVLRNYRLCELMPYNGGVVEIEAALLALKGANYLDLALNLLQAFSGLLVAPVGQVLSVAQQVSSGVQQMLGLTDGNIHLGFHQAFVAAGGSGAVLKPGYHAVILGTPDKIDATCLSVKDAQLQYKQNDQIGPFQGYDYMLFFVEGRKERDDWRLADIEAAINQAIAAMSNGDMDRARGYKTVALATAWQSPDLAVYDRRRVVDAIKEELAAIEGGGLGAVGGETRDLNAIMQARGISRSKAEALGELSFEEAMAG